MTKNSKDYRFLVQETAVARRHRFKKQTTTARIKSHHEYIGGLPNDMTFKLVEPLRNLFKDKISDRQGAGAARGDRVPRRPFPGPGSQCASWAR